MVILARANPWQSSTNVLAQRGDSRGSAGAVFRRAGTRESALRVLLGMSGPGFIHCLQLKCSPVVSGQSLLKLVAVK